MMSPSGCAGSSCEGDGLTLELRLFVWLIKFTNKVFPFYTSILSSKGDGKSGYLYFYVFILSVYLNPSSNLKPNYPKQTYIKANKTQLKPIVLRKVYLFLFSRFE